MEEFLVSGAFFTQIKFLQAIGHRGSFKNYVTLKRGRGSKFLIIFRKDNPKKILKGAKKNQRNFLGTPQVFF